MTEQRFQIKQNIRILLREAFNVRINSRNGAYELLYTVNGCHSNGLLSVLIYVQLLLYTNKPHRLDSLEIKVSHVIVDKPP